MTPSKVVIFTQTEKDALFANLDAKIKELDTTADNYRHDPKNSQVVEWLFSYDNKSDGVDNKKDALELVVKAIKKTFMNEDETKGEEDKFKVNLEKFNEAFETLSQNIAIQRGTFSTKMSKTEQYLSELRNEVNYEAACQTALVSHRSLRDSKDRSQLTIADEYFLLPSPKKDMFVETLSALFREQNRINKPKDSKSKALGELIKTIQDLAKETNPMKLYQAIVNWETTNKVALSVKRGMFAPKSSAAVDALKREIVLQAFADNRLNVGERHDFISAIKMPTQNGQANTYEIRKLEAHFQREASVTTSRHTV